MTRTLISLPPTLSPQLRSNFIYLLLENATWSLYLGSTSIFLAIYASRCGASAQQIGLLTAIPALIAVFISLPIGSWINRFPIQKVASWSAFSTRVLLIFYAVLPWILPTRDQFTAILVLTVVMTFPTTVINISFSQLLMESIPAEWRSSVIGGRIAISSLVSFGVTLLCGQILTRVVFPTNYQVVFAIGFIGGMLSIYQIAHIRPFTTHPTGVDGYDQSTAAIPRSAAAQKPKFSLAISSQGWSYLRVIGLLFGLGMVMNMVAPLIPTLLVHRLNLSDGWISLGTATSTLLVFLVSFNIARITRRTGNRRGSFLGIALLACQTVMLGLAYNSSAYLASAVVGGTATGIINVALTNYMFDHVPDTERAKWLSINVMLGNVSGILGALGGPLIASLLGLPLSLIIMGGVELIFGIVIVRWG